MAAVLLGGCAGTAAPRAEVSATDAVRAMDRGQTSEAVRHAEAAVQAEPRNAEYRMVLGNAYLEEGRFASASTSFADAMALGENSPRAALSLALSLSGEGRFAESSAMLRQWEGEIAAADLGLAYALAGEPERGIHILSNSIRQGDNTVKTRQNLAYAYAVAGRWRDARLMVAQDVPADQVGDRMQQWAQLTHAEAYQHRLAGLLGVPAGVRDAGQPVHLALVNNPGVDQLAAETYAAAPAAPVAQVQAPSPTAELPPLAAPAAMSGTPVTAEEPASFAEAFTAPEPARAPALAPIATAAPSERYAASPVVQSVRNDGEARMAAAATAAHAAATPARPTRRAAAASGTGPATASFTSAPVADGSHLVQLGSFSSEAAARRAWDIYTDRHPALANHEMVITEAVVRGKRYWRVSAGGFDTASSRAMCSNVNTSAAGEGCISWAASSPLPGAVDNGVRLARR
ncbi:hypothetical protein AAW01_06585 [Aurantiacibacter gangjinensis]|uniref:SPOR domain-containing protein n=2 Tax=Aurantiacibacter gangjinensis TaxID=502682 RepID=A0A0G9MSM5_9SPHN|nr:hypothetical protein AAW01_06585 [Aurantiacibacter gangjinensis]